MSLYKQALFFLLITLPLGILGAPGSPGGEELGLDRLLPKTIYGWEAAAKDNLFDRRTIFDYMNGAGEIYLAYDFRILLVREYTEKSSPPIAADIYQMSSSEDAYGNIASAAAYCSHRPPSPNPMKNAVMIMTDVRDLFCIFSSFAVPCWLRAVTTAKFIASRFVVGCIISASL